MKVQIPQWLRLEIVLTWNVYYEWLRYVEKRST